MASDVIGRRQTEQRKRIGRWVVRTSRPAKGWYWYGQNKAGENIWVYDPGHADVKPPKPPTPPAPSGGGGVYYSGGGGTTADKGLSTYIQEYRLRFHPGGKPPEDLLKKAEAGNWSIAYFDQQVRMTDPTYLRSVEAKTLLPDFSRTMRILFPGLADRTKQAQLMKSSFYRRAAKWYLQNGIGLRQNGEESLYNYITGTRRWNKANPYWKDYARNRNIGVVAEANPIMYKSYLESLRQNFKEYGMELPEDYYRAFFRSRYASKSGIGDLQKNLQQVAEQGQSFGWFTGEPLSKKETKTTLFGGKEQTDLRRRLAKSFGIRSSFLSSEPKSVGTDLSEQNKLVKPLL